ncbi:30S ribosomal protein S3 [Patescibacteria group bacterium]|nr:30S ribosomal protein S3 [Patescibacteria group bacterium]
MGQKVNPTGFRLGSFITWKSTWYADPRQYSDTMLEDHKLREFLEKKLAGAGVVQISIERSLTMITVVLHVSRPGVVIGKGGANLEVIKKDIERILNVSKQKKDKVKIDIRVQEVKKPDLSAKLVAERIVDQLIKRYPHRRAVSQAMEKVMAAGAKGVKIALAGRIGGAEISRTEKYFEGKVPTQTLRANIDYYEVPAKTRSGYVGIKVWIYKGELAN